MESINNRPLIMKVTTAVMCFLILITGNVMYKHGKIFAEHAAALAKAATSTLIAGNASAIATAAVSINSSKATKFSRSTIIPFVIFYQGSQGSTWLLEALSEYRGVCILGNELIDRIKDNDKKIAFIEHATQKPEENSGFKSWKQSLVDLTAEKPSEFDHVIMDKCRGEEFAYGYKARLTIEEMKYVLNKDTQLRLDIRVIILSRNPVKQSLSAYRRNFEAHDQRKVNFLKLQMEESCRDHSKREPVCKEKIDAFEAAKNHKSTDLDTAKFKNEMAIHTNYYLGINKLLHSLGSKTQQNILHVKYEDMVTNMDKLMKSQVLPFLGIAEGTSAAKKDPKKISRQFFSEKATPDLLCGAVADFKNFCALIRTSFASPSTSGLEKLPIMNYTNVDACTSGVNVSKASSKGSSSKPVACCPRCCDKAPSAKEVLCV